MRVRDEATQVLAETAFPTEFEKPISMRVSAKGETITFEADGVSLSVNDAGPEALSDGGVGLLVHEGALSANEIRIGAV